MPKKRAPIIEILRYFETADLPLADQAFTLVRATMARRHSAQPPSAAKENASTKRSHHKKPDGGPQDVPLPGLVSEVGG